MTEWLKVLLSKSSVPVTVPRVRIPLSPPYDAYTVLMQDSIFTRIVKGEIPAHKVYEDGLVLAFLDIHPAQPGHTLVIPKRQVEFVWDLPDEDYAAVMAAAKKVALTLREVLGMRYVGERIVGIDVPHAHVQLIPFNTAQEFRAAQDMESEPDHAALAAMAERLHIRDGA
jgi:histidine triad (HIT) family protein